MPVQSIDAAITLSSSVLNRAKHYLGPDEQAPKGVKVQQGARGGKFYEMDGGAGGGEPEEAAGGKGQYQKGDMVLYMENTLQGPKQRLGKVDVLRPDGLVEVRTQNGSIKKIRPDQLKPHQPQQQELDERGYPKPQLPERKPDLEDQMPVPEFRGKPAQVEIEHWQQALERSQTRLKVMQQSKAPLADVMQEAKRRDSIQDKLGAAMQRQKGEQKFGRSNAKAGAARAAGGGAAGIGPKAGAAIADAEKLLGDLKAGKLANPQEYVDAARRAVQVYEQERAEQGPDADPKRAPLAQAAETAEKIRDRAKELAEKWRDRYTYAKQKGVPGEELDAVKGRMEEAGKEFLQANAAHYKAAQALAGYDQPKRQPKPRQPKQARPVVQHQPGDLDREREQHEAARGASSPRQMLQQHRQKKAQPHRKIDMRQENRDMISIG